MRRGTGKRTGIQTYAVNEMESFRKISRGIQDWSGGWRE